MRQLRFAVLCVIAGGPVAAAATPYVDGFNDGGLDEYSLFVAGDGVISIPASGGNPGFYLRMRSQDADPRCYAVSSRPEWVGNWGAAGITGVTADTWIGAEIPPTDLTVRISSSAADGAGALKNLSLDTGTAGANGWVRSLFVIDPSWTNEQAIANGWTVLSGPSLGEAVSWNDMLSSVDQLTFEWYDVAHAGFRHMQIGADNLGLVPGPGGLMVAGLCGATLERRRRPRSARQR